jgi:hypothetical protein
MFRMPALPNYLMHAMKQTSRVCLLHAFMICSYMNFYLLVTVQFFYGSFFSEKAFLFNQWCTDPFHYFPVSLRYIADDPLHIVAERNKILPCLCTCTSICQLSPVLILSSSSSITYISTSESRPWSYHLTTRVRAKHWLRGFSKDLQYSLFCLV